MGWDVNKFRFFFRRVELTSRVGTVISFVVVGFRPPKKAVGSLLVLLLLLFFCVLPFAVVSANAAEPYNFVLDEAKERESAKLPW